MSTKAVEIEAVDGLGRLLVRYVGLPMVWARTGNWAQIILHLALIVGAMVAAAHDYEPEDDEDDEDPSGTPEPVRRRSLLRSVVQSPANFLGLILLAGLFLLPATGAAFTASTTSTADSWSRAQLELHHRSHRPRPIPPLEAGRDRDCHNCG
ncbi:MAG: hypothetical protein M3P87_04780 [Actinomycetota bacterium]|nr:hypothetical protein [Actinomycetota bacterium]